MAGELREYTAWIRKEPCAACGGPGPCEAHHHTDGDTVAPGEPRPSKSVGTKRGKGQRAHDYFSIALHVKCHGQLHDLRGFFDGWSGQRLREWQDAQVADHRARYEAHLEKHPPPATKARVKGKAKTNGSDWTTGANAERVRIAEWLRNNAANPHMSADAAAALNDCAQLLEERDAPMAQPGRA